MESKTVQEQQDNIEKLLEQNSVLILFGEGGMKTWMAREVSNSVVHKGLVYGTLWFSLNKTYDGRSPLADMARKISLFRDFEEWEAESEIVEEGKISEKVEELRSIIEKKNSYLLLVLDDVPSNMNEEKVVSLLELINGLLEPRLQSLLKILITSRNKEIDISFHDRSKEFVEIFPLSDEESSTLMCEKVEEKVKNMPNFKETAETIGKNCGIPTPVYVIAEALNHIAKENWKDWTLERALEEAASHCNIDDISNSSAMSLMRCGYDMLPRSDLAMINCCWHSRQFFRKNDGVHYNELIANWILDGCFGPIDHVDKAYNDGHRVLMKLIDRCMLKIAEDNVVVMEKVAQDVPDCRYDGFIWKPTLGLSGVYEDGNWLGLGRVAPANGRIRTLCDHKGSGQVSTLLVDGSHLCREVIETYFDSMQDLQVLAIFSPRIKSLPESSITLEKLRFLVLRDCDLLEKIVGLEKLESLTVLEISNARNLKDIPSSVFESLSKLRSLNLSETGIQELPSSLSKLSELRSINLRRCSSLKSLPILKNLVKLQLLDLSGATSLENFADKSIGSLQDLQLLDISQTQVGHFPFPKGLKQLSRLSLRDCKKLIRLPKLTSLEGLQVLDLSGALMLKEIRDDIFSYENDLKILDLSKTAVSRLPSSVSDLSNLEFLNLSETLNLIELDVDTFKYMKCLRHLDLSKSLIENLPSLSNLANLQKLLLQECKIRKLPSLEAHKKLEVLDLSGCVSFEAIEDESFEHMTRLQLLNLSETKIDKLPSLSGLHKLCKLLISNCINLTELPSLVSSELQELNVCGATKLKEPEAKFPESMNQLQILNLSGTGVKSLPLINYSNLKELSLRGCLELQTPPHLDNLTKLEVLDLSETHINALPSISKLCNLRQLLLRDCSDLQEIPTLESLVHLEVLDLQGTGIKKFPCKMEKLTRLTHLNLPDSIDNLELNWKDIKSLPGELNWDQCSIFKPSELQNIKNRPSITIRNMDSLRIMKGIPEIWNSCFKKFFVSTCRVKEQKEDEEIYVLRNEASLRNIYFDTISYRDEYVPFLEIRGFESFPTGIEDALMQAEYVSLVENVFIRSLSELGKLNTLKGCWIESCTNLEKLIQRDDDKFKFWQNLEILWMSNLPSLRNVHITSYHFESFGKLKELYIDCCPQLETVFISSIQPLPENLEILHVKFCDELQTLFRTEPTEECTMQNLHTLNLVELPELASIGLKLPSLRTANIRNCPKLGDLSVEYIMTKEKWDGSAINVTPEMGNPSITSLVAG